MPPYHYFVTAQEHHDIYAHYQRLRGRGSLTCTLLHCAWLARDTDEFVRFAVAALVPLMRLYRFPHLLRAVQWFVRRYAVAYQPLRCEIYRAIRARLAGARAATTTRA